LHDVERFWRIKFKLANGNSPVEPKMWVQTFKDHLSDKGLEAALIKLAITPLSVFSKDMFLDSKKQKLASSAVTTFWVGAYRYLGAPWEYPTTPAPKILTPRNREPPSYAATAAAPTKTPSKISTDVKKISFSHDTKMNSLFISRPVRKLAPPPAKPKPADTRTHVNTFFTLTLAEIDVDWREAGPPAIASFLAAAEHLFATDKKARIQGWTIESLQPFTKKSVPITTKSQLKKYYSTTFFRTNHCPIGRICVSHDIDPSELEIDGLEFTIEHETIQERAKTSIGFLVGSMPEHINLADMSAAHMNHSVLKALKVECIKEGINLAPGRNPLPPKDQIYAVHIRVGESQALLARALYNGVYGSRKLGGFPQGVAMKFVPAIDDRRYPVTPAMRIKTIKMMSKQKVFTESLEAIHTTTIVGLHLYIPQIGYTLCQILMSMKSFNDPNMGLFISIDEHILAASYVVTFMAHRDRAVEATSLVPLLCLVLEHRFGPLIWEWFTDDAKKAKLDWKWVAEESRIAPLISQIDDDDMSLESDDGFTATMIAVYGVDTTQKGDGFEFDLGFVISDEALNQASNQYGDTGSVKTFRAECATPPPFASPKEKHPSAMDSELHMASDSEGPDGTTVSTDSQGTSALTDSTLDVEASLEAMMLSHPDLLKKLLTKTKILSNSIPTPNAVSPHKGVDGN
jgi:hypothetical protein